MKTIGFVILTWNSEKVIKNCLDSIIGLEHFIPKIVIVDNGSSDGTIDILDKYKKEYQNILKLIYYPTNKGTTVSRNAGLMILQKESPDYFCILDSDTQVNDEAFVKLVLELDSHIKYGLIGPLMVTSDGLIQMSARAFPTLREKIYKAISSESFQKKGEEMEKQIPEEYADSYPVDYLMSACWLIKPEVIENVGLLDEKIFYAPEDAEYCIRVWKAGYQVAFCPKAQIIHEWQRLSKKKLISKMNWEHIKGLMYMFHKHHYLVSTEKLKKSFVK